MDAHDPIPGIERPVLAPVSNADQSRIPITPACPRGNELPRRPMQEGCTIWICGSPSDPEKAAVMHLLRPCRGLLDVSESRVSSPSKLRNNRGDIMAIEIQKVVGHRSRLVCE